MAFKFERLEVWQKSIQLSFHVHELTRLFPKEETYILASQIKRAADSVALNIAEGSTGQTDAEFKLFLGYAIRSAVEIVTCLDIAKARELVRERNFSEIYSEAEEVVKMLQGLRNSLG